jgi:glycosyltransferase involved in cell wall biosynthesis
MLQEVSSLASSVGGVVIHQPTSQIFHAYQESSFMITTSLFEPFGLVIPEAMSCGLPVVAFDCPYGPADLIDNGKNGYLIKDRAFNAFVDRICELIEKPALRMTMGQAALGASQRFTAERVMPLWLQLFSLLLPSVNNHKQVSV